jgi:hypothetical protein
MQTTQDVIKLLPFQDAFKQELLSKWDSMSPDQRYAMERLIWDLYDAIYQARLDENLQKAFERAKANQEKLDHEFYERVRKETDMQLQQEFSQTETAVELSDTREELEKILKQTA